MSIRFTLILMPRLVHSSRFTNHSICKTADCRLSTVDKRRRRFGFTLLELLLAITIAGTLASIITVTFVGEQKKARDTQRKRDLNTVKSTLEIVKRDCNNIYYPFYGGISGQSAYNNLNTYLVNANLKYIGVKILDPKPQSGFFYGYYYKSSALFSNVCPDSGGGRNGAGIKEYILRATLENASDPDIQKSFDRCSGKPGIPGSPGTYYFVCND